MSGEICFAAGAIFDKGTQIYQDLRIKIQKIATLDEAGDVLSETQSIFGFRCYYVLDMSRVSERMPISFLYPSNISAHLFQKLDKCLTDFATQLFTHAAGNFSPVPWDMEESFREGHISEIAANALRASSLTMGLSFPALGISGSPRLIGFSGDRPALDSQETDNLNFLMIQLHARLTVVGRGQAIRRDPISELEKHILSLAADGESFDSISNRIALSSRAVQYLVDSICRKMEVATLEHAVAIALRRKVIT